ncbi:TIGR01457 family HAD-type hydrolase, partial [Candidatus Bipolaricaulota bacterium]|nr:TIGR01457 family HAD-type hydrolase [Candidatus Bipolaricaulota bacterium]
MKTWNLRHYAAFLLDVDGVLVHDSRPIQGAADAVRLLQQLGQVLVVTNNSTRSRQQHASRLSTAGFDIHPDDIISSAYAAAKHLQLHHGGVCVWPIGEQGLADELLARGHTIATKPYQAQWVVAGMDRFITYQKLTDGLHALNSGARLIATN